MMAAMRKMLMVAYRLLKTKETYDPAKVFAQPCNRNWFPRGLTMK